jgi:hypothetical protein
MGCSNCKKKKEEIEVQEVPQINTDVNVEELLWAHQALHASGMTDEHKNRVNSIYYPIFNENVNFGCGGCKEANLRRLDHYIREVLKIQI